MGLTVHLSDGRVVGIMGCWNDDVPPANQCAVLSLCAGTVCGIFDLFRTVPTHDCLLPSALTVGLLKTVVSCFFVSFNL